MKEKLIGEAVLGILLGHRRPEYLQVISEEHQRLEAERKTAEEAAAKEKAENADKSTSPDR